MFSELVFIMDIYQIYLLNGYNPSTINHLINNVTVKL